GAVARTTGVVCCLTDQARSEQRLQRKRDGRLRDAGSARDLRAGYRRLGPDRLEHRSLVQILEQGRRSARRRHLVRDTDSNGACFLVLDARVHLCKSHLVCVPNQNTWDVKLAVVGGGSTYPPELVAGLAREAERLELREVVLQDIDAERREIVGGLAARMLEAAGYSGELSITDDLDRAVDAASFVLVQLRVGGQSARLSDETIPLACGCIGQETTGAGGLGKALRTVPVVLEIAERVRELAADDAWIVDFTNPVGIVVRGLLDAGHRAVGLCNVAIGIQRSMAAMLEVEPERVQVGQVGLNHLTWVRALYVDGDDVLPALLADSIDELAERIDFPAPVLERLGVIPSYYLRYFYFHDEILEEQRNGKPRATEVAEIERELLELYRDPSLNTKPALLERPGGASYSEAAPQPVAALATGR